MPTLSCRSRSWDLWPGWLVAFWWVRPLAGVLLPYLLRVGFAAALS